MTARWDAGLDRELEAGLFDLGGAIAPQPAPGLAGAVRRRVESRPVPGSSAPRSRCRLGGWADRRVGGRPTAPARARPARSSPCSSSPGSRRRSASGCRACASSSSVPASRGRRATATSRPDAGASPMAPGSVAPSVAPTAPPLRRLARPGATVDPAGPHAAAAGTVPWRPSRSSAPRSRHSSAGRRPMRRDPRLRPDRDDPGGVARSGRRRCAGRDPRDGAARDDRRRLPPEAALRPGRRSLRPGRRARGVLDRRRAARAALRRPRR